MEKEGGEFNGTIWASGAVFTARVLDFGWGVLGGFHTLLCVIYDITLSTNANAKAGGEIYTLATCLLCRGAPGNF